MEEVGKNRKGRDVGGGGGNCGQEWRAFMAGQTWNQLLRLTKRRTSEGLWWEQLFSKTGGSEPLWLDKTFFLAQPNER